MLEQLGALRRGQLGCDLEGDLDRALGQPCALLDDLLLQRFDALRGQLPLGEGGEDPFAERVAAGRKLGKLRN